MRTLSISLTTPPPFYFQQQEKAPITLNVIGASFYPLQLGNHPVD